MAVLAAVCTLRMTPNAASAETPKLKIIRLELPCGARRPPAVVLPVIAKGVLNISENVSIQNNQAVKYGGGIYSNGTVEINGTNVMISGNKAERGGGILGDGNSNTTITGNVTISNNTAEVMTDTTNIYGGGCCFHSGSTATLSGTGVVLEGNVAKAVTTALKPGNFAVGGGIYFGGNSLTLKDITIRGGLTDGSYNAERGGAIATSGSTVEMTGVTIDGNPCSETGRRYLSQQ